MDRDVTHFIATILTICIACLIVNTAQMTSFRCTYNVGSTSSLQQLMNSSTEAIWQFSLTACAILCKKRACVSYSYDPLTKQCLTRNVNTAFPGYLCGIAADQARLSCKEKGEAYVAFGGNDSTALQCVCGTERKTLVNWIFYSNTSSYNCIDTCTGRPCVIKMGFGEPCVACNGDQSFCQSGYNPNNIQVSLCTPIT